MNRALFVPCLLPLLACAPAAQESYRDQQRREQIARDVAYAHDSAAAADEEAQIQRDQERVAAEDQQVREQDRARREERRQQASDAQAQGDAYRHSREGLAARACEIKQQIAEYDARLQREKRIQKQSGVSDRRVVYGATASKIDLQDELKDVEREYGGKVACQR